MHNAMYPQAISMRLWPAMRHAAAVVLICAPRSKHIDDGVRAWSEAACARVGYAVGAMKIEDVPFAAIDWSQVATTEHAGSRGKAIWRTIEVGNVRVRKVEYSAGYIADHWCSRGHVLLVLDGELVTELSDGRRFVLHAGMSYHVADGAEPHRSSTEGGARLFIVE